jgi:hypothetical protein
MTCLLVFSSRCFVGVNAAHGYVGFVCLNDVWWEAVFVWCECIYVVNRWLSIKVGQCLLSKNLYPCFLIYIYICISSTAWMV